MLVSSVYRAYAVYQQPRSFGSTRVTRAEEKRDYVTLSTQAKDFQSVRNALSNIPDIREERVKAVAEKFRTENYGIDVSNIADKMISRFFEN